jgi:L-malate glycosyltransferase
LDGRQGLQCYSPTVSLSIFIAHPSELLTDHEPHGDGLVAHGFIRALADRGHTLHVAAQRAALRDCLPANVELHVLGAGGGQGDRGRLARVLYMRRLRQQFEVLARHTRFDVIHQLNPVSAGISLALADAEPPVILGPYVPPWPAEGQWLRTRSIELAGGSLRGLQQRRATTALLSTPAAAVRLRPAIAGRLYVRELSSGIDTRLWRPPDVDIRNQDILFLANLEPRKGIHVALDAFAQLAAMLPEARLLVGGGGSQYQELRAIISRSPALRRVELLGPVSHQQVPELMRACAVHCAPAFGEPFGMTTLEAMACGKPVVATDAGGLRHLVRDGGGRRVPVGDSAALAGALHEILTSPGLQRGMGEFNRRRVEQRFTWTHVIDRLEAVYAEAIAARAR